MGAAGGRVRDGGRDHGQSRGAGRPARTGARHAARQHPQDRMPQGAPELHWRPASRRRATDPLYLSRTNFRRLHFQSAAQMADRHAEHLGEIGGWNSTNSIAEERRLRERDYNSGFRLLNMSTELEEKQTAPESAEEQIKIPETLPVLPLRDIVIFPFMIVPLFVSRERSTRAVDQALAENRMIMLTAQ